MFESCHPDTKKATTRSLFLCRGDTLRYHPAPSRDGGRTPQNPLPALTKYHAVAFLCRGDTRTLKFPAEAAVEEGGVGSEGEFGEEVEVFPAIAGADGGDAGEDGRPTLKDHHS